MKTGVARKGANNSDKVHYMAQLITKHQEQKEAFLKVYTRIVSARYHVILN